MRPPRHQWPDTNGSRGILLFAQTMREMLGENTFESFRAYSLDTLARIAEAIEIAEDVRQNVVPQAVLRAPIDELRWSVNKDQAARSLADLEIDSLLKITKSNNFSLDDIDAHLRFIHKKIEDNYKQQLENVLLSEFDDVKRIPNIRKVTGFYCSHLINIGYSRQRILEVIEEKFITYPVQRVGRQSLSSFFRNFDGKNKKYVVHVAITKEFGSYLQQLNFEVKNVKDISNDKLKSLSRNGNIRNYPSVLEEETEEMDPYGAMDSVYQLLSGQRAISYLDRHGMQSEWGDTMHVSLKKAKTGVAIKKEVFLKKITRRVSGGSSLRTRIISRYAQAIIRNFDEPSTERVLSSIRTAALARTSENPENQMISLWSAIEVLLSEPRGRARIVHYAELITPCITLRHSLRQLQAVYDGLRLSYRLKIMKLIEPLEKPDDINSLAAFSRLLFLPEYAHLKQSLLNILSDNPLAQYRINKIHSDYATCDKALKSIDDHFERVNWQIHRIYRTRNQLVHAGKMPSYLESMMFNASEYYRSAIFTIVSRASRDQYICDIDEVVSEIGIEYKIRKEILKRGGNRIMNERYLRLLLDKK